ncbi:NAD-dependent epimerase/dehydratase family protein [Capnocytophaga sp.]|uniref:NAD-dependent epimerase/dehydratase family protein n=1 Tax=Capnocytophaga sp. TaxID=44737 RepID=UPI0026DBBAC0|nr:NAD-dependent epimerase/dehydratase family protein [Capnocytophaga sp.]MDO5106063.1 NAD-dependent epimerase/dehydratase family protein [Capnocytophaga sp.]
MILVTGGTGLIGCHLLYYLTQNEGNKVRATYRSERSLEKTKKVFQHLSNDGVKRFAQIEWIKADINNIPELETAFRDVVFVFHAAGFISFSPNDFDKLIKINVEGTANIVNLCVDFQVKKLCYVSSVAVLSPTFEGFRNETSLWNPEVKNSDYAISKHGGEMEVWRGSQEGLDVVVINPSVVLGAHFWDSGSGLFFKKVADGLSFFPSGGTGFVAVEDVVRAMVALQFSSVVNERFVLNAENQPYEKVLKTIAHELNVIPPKWRVTHKMLRFFARIDGFLSFLRLKKRTINLQSADSLGLISGFDGNKIKQYIDFQYTSIDTSIKKACEAYRQK